MGVRFTGWGTALPDRVVTNDELSLTLDTSDAWITERTGIRERRIGGSARRAWARWRRRRGAAGHRRRARRDRLPRPRDHHARPAHPRPPRADDRRRPRGSAARRWTSTPRAAASCTPVRTAQGLLETGNRRILVIGAENLSRWVDWTDRTMAVLFGDGAGAVVLEYDDRRQRPAGLRRRRRRLRGRPDHLRARRLLPDGRQGGLPPRGAHHGRLRRAGAEGRRRQPSTTSASSSPTRPTCASSRRPAQRLGVDDGPRGRR